jgi:hypothetical protein
MSRIMMWQKNRWLVCLLYDRASICITVKVGYITLVFSETEENMFSLFKAVIYFFSSDEEALES